MAQRVCPVWLGYFLASPIRRLLLKPESVIGPYIRPGMTVLDAGCAMGFFSLPAARLAGPGGRVVCVDLQPGMIRSLKKRAARAGLDQRIEGRVCSGESLLIDDLAGKVDFVMIIAVAHEVPDLPRFFGELHTCLVPDGRLLIAEPRGHVSGEDFDNTLKIAEKVGLVEVSRPAVPRSRSALLEGKD